MSIEGPTEGRSADAAPDGAGPDRVGPAGLPPKVEKPATHRDLGPVDVAPLKALLARLTDRFWASEDRTKENAFAVFHHTEHIVCRFIENNADPRSWYERPIWPVVAPVVEPQLLRIVAPYGFAEPVFPKVMFARLAPHASIDRHVDGAGSNPRVHKIHVPIHTHPSVLFEVADSTFHLAAGRAYEVNNIAPHGVRNDSDRPRVHLIFEAFDAAR